jgi:hypothetical protein
MRTAGGNTPFFFFLPDTIMKKEEKHAMQNTISLL